MIKNICLFLIAILLLEIQAIGSVPPLILEGKEVIWAGEVELKNDVIVPAGTALTIMPGTKIYGIYEYNNDRATPEAWKIIVEGELFAAGDAENPVTFEPIPAGLSSLRIPIDSRIKNITIAPKEIDTEKIRNEFRTFRTTYAILWILLFASITYAIKN